MSTARFSITYETITQESAEDGEAESQGYIAESLTLRDAFNALRFDGYAQEADCWPCLRPRWLTFGADVDYRAGAETSKSIHFPESITTASARRVARVFGFECGNAAFQLRI